MNDSKAESWTPTYEEIARRAYALFEARGESPGGTWDDWIAAEQQLRAERPSTPDPDRPVKAKPERSHPKAGAPTLGRPKRGRSA